jgi:hypothetical protein
MWCGSGHPSVQAPSPSSWLHTKVCAFSVVCCCSLFRCSFWAITPCWVWIGKIICPHSRENTPCEASFFLLLLLLDLSGPNWVVMGDAERTKDRQTDRQKVGPGVLGTWVETLNSLIASFLYYSLHLLCCFSLSLFFKALLLYNSSKPCF